MTHRLRELCALIERTDSFIDVGCDHGYAVRYVYEKALADKITACDISAPSLRKAENLIGADSGVNFVCEDGRTAAKGYETVLISGFGGLETASIIACTEPKVFILSPHSHVREVRETLLRRDYDIAVDKVIRDGRKFYDIIKATLGGGIERLRETDELMLEFGMNVREPNGELAARLGERLRKLRGYKATEENKAKTASAEEAIKWQLR